MSWLLLFLLVAPQVSAPLKWSGRLTIGAQVYAVTGTSVRGASGGEVFSVDISTAERKIFEISGMVGSEGGELYVNGAKVAVPRKTAESWGRQLRNRLEPPIAVEEYECTTAGTQRTCDSRGIVELERFLAGKVRLVYNLGRLHEIRFFSLAEWTNPFGEYVSLSLQIE